MPKVWIGKVEAPESVPLNYVFGIKWREWFLVWPFKEYKIISRIDLKKVDLEDLTLVQSVQPAKRYKPNQDGSPSTFGKRSAALERLLDQPIKSRIKLKFVITKKPLPGITNPSKSGVKPIDYMYPVDMLEDKDEIDLEWYKKMIENFINGAFGLSGVVSTEQTGLDAWM